MRSKSISRSLRLFLACALGGGMFLTGCTLGDIRSNLVAGTLTYDTYAQQVKERIINSVELEISEK